jgi:acyl carrier protein
MVGRVEVDELRAHVRRSLPEYMVPSAFAFLETFPLSANGKLDRKALPAPELASAEGYVAPRTRVEEVLAGIWAEVLDVERVGANDNFFDLGGHSFLVAQVVSRLRELLDVELPLYTLFEHRTVKELARVVAELAPAGPASEPAPGPESNPHHLLAVIDGLSEETLDRLLGAQA